MADTKISALTALDSTADLSQLSIPLFKADGSPDNARMLASTMFQAVKQLSVTPAWSGTGTATTPFLVNVTADPGPAAAASKLLDLQVGGTSRVNATKDALTSIIATSTITGSLLSVTRSGEQPLLDAVQYGAGLAARKVIVRGEGLYACPDDNSNQVAMISQYGIRVASDLSIGWSNSAANVVNVDTSIFRTAADRLALRRGANAQRFEVYRTYTDATTWERGVMSWYNSASDNGTAGTTFRVGTEKGSVGGTGRDVSFIVGGGERMLLSATDGSLTKTHAGTYSGPAISAPIRIQTDAAGGGFVIANSSTEYTRFVSGGLYKGFDGAGSVPFVIWNSGPVKIGSSSGTPVLITNGSGDSGPGKLAIDNVQGANLERLKMEWDTNVARIGTEKAGSGTSRAVAVITNNTVRVTYGASGGETKAEGHDVTLGTTTGTKIGTATGEKLAFWNATPVVQQVLATGGGATVDNVITLLQTLGLCKQS